MDDRHSQIVEDIKWFLFDDSVGFDHMLQFVTWNGDGESFIVSDGESEYRVRVTKEIE